MARILAILGEDLFDFFVIFSAGFLAADFAATDFAVTFSAGLGLAMAVLRAEDAGLDFCARFMVVVGL